MKLNRTAVLWGMIIITIVFALGILFSNSNLQVFNASPARPPAVDPLDVSYGVANRWLMNERATSSITLATFLEGEPLVTTEARAALLGATDGDLDPLLCQDELPGRIGVKPVYQTGTAAEVMVIARGTAEPTGYSLITLTLDGDAWVITNVACGNEAPVSDSQYPFAKAGVLARESVPAPYDNSVWHVITGGGTSDINAVPLQFDERSSCRGVNGEVGLCNEVALDEGVTVYVQADTTETGALVRLMEVTE
jgi:hypothetical protein